jgi:metallo-beta-lactamase family protein
MIELQFLGACERVTGSCYLLKTDRARVLIDCGLIQGSDAEEAQNAAPFAFDVEQLDAVILTHAHLDHSGRLPLLHKAGYRGPIFTHRASRDLCRIMLRDAAYLNEMDARLESRKRARRGEAPVAPLYTQQDAADTLKLFRGARYEEPVKVAPGVVAHFRDAGHILGAAFVELSIGDGENPRRITFSGDLGNGTSPLMRAPERPQATELMLLESTYGDRIHPAWSRTVEHLHEVLDQAHADGGIVLIPSFAVGRTQEILLLLHQHYEAWHLDRWRVHLDGPLGVQATSIYAHHASLLGADAVAFAAQQFRLPNMQFARTPGQSQQLNNAKGGTLIIAGAGMCSGGRIRHHLKHHLWKPNTHVLLVGYQAYGTLGRRLQDGAQTVSLWGESIRVAAKIHTIHGLSAHADANTLLHWYRQCPNRPQVALVHGEPQATEALAGTLEGRCGARTLIPKLGERIRL